jgi:hypothetical protein
MGVAVMAGALGYLLLQIGGLVHLFYHLEVGAVAPPVHYTLAGGEQAVAPAWAAGALQALDLLLSYGWAGVAVALGILGLAGFALWLRTESGRRLAASARPLPDEEVLRKLIEEEVDERLDGEGR